MNTKCLVKCLNEQTKVKVCFNLQFSLKWYVIGCALYCARVTLKLRDCLSRIQFHIHLSSFMF